MQVDDFAEEGRVEIFEKLKLNFENFTRERDITGEDETLNRGGTTGCTQAETKATSSTLNTQAFLIKNRLGFLGKIGLDLHSVREMSEDDMRHVGLSVLEQIRVNLAFGRVANDGEAVRTFLAHLDLSRHAPAFAEHNVDLDTVELLTDEDLQDIGITLESDRKAIQSAALSNRNSQHSLKTPPSPSMLHHASDSPSSYPSFCKERADVEADEGGEYGSVYRGYKDCIMRLSCEERVQAGNKIFRACLILHSSNYMK